MRSVTFLSASVLALASRVLAQAQVDAIETGSVDALAPAARDELRDEVREWLASAAGQDALHLGFEPGVSASPSPPAASRRGLAVPQDVTLDQLQRFLDAKATIAKLQQRQPQAIFTLNTPFALLTPTEFAQYVNASNVPAQRRLLEQQDAPRGGGGSMTLRAHDDRWLQTQQQQKQQLIPAERDWQREGCVGRVKNQGQCGVCWAFSAIAALEAGYCVSSGAAKTLLELSEQDVVSCGPADGICSSGWSSLAYDWMIRYNGGSVCSEASFAYESFNGSSPSCRRYDDPRAACAKPDVGLVSYVANQFPDHEELKKVVAFRPVSAQVTASVSYFQFYGGGVLMGDEEQCPTAQAADHEVAIVGYGERDGTSYWKIKNSWGPQWGDQGFMYLERGYQGATYGACGIENWSYYPVFRSQAPATDARRCSVLDYGVEYVGPDLWTTTTFDSGECCDTCRSDPACVAYVFSDEHKQCRLKSRVDEERPVGDQGPYWNSALVVPKAEADKLCLPVEDHVDYVGADIMRAQAKTAGECCDLCQGHVACRVYTWTRFNGGMCFLKYARNEIKRHTPPADGSVYFKSGEVYKCSPLVADTDYPGEDFKSVPAKQAELCCGLCRDSYPCQAFAWSDYQGGTCWLKKQASTPVKAMGVTIGRLIQ